MILYQLLDRASCHCGCMEVPIDTYGVTLLDMPFPVAAFCMQSLAVKLSKGAWQQLQLWQGTPCWLPLCTYRVSVQTLGCGRNDRTETLTTGSGTTRM